MIAVNNHDADECTFPAQCLFPRQKRIPEQPNTEKRVKESDANCGQLSKDQKGELMATLNWFI